MRGVRAQVTECYSGRRKDDLDDQTRGDERAKGESWRAG